MILKDKPITYNSELKKAQEAWNKLSDDFDRYKIDAIEGLKFSEECRLELIKENTELKKQVNEQIEENSKLENQLYKRNKRVEVLEQQLDNVKYMDENTLYKILNDKLRAIKVEADNEEDDDYFDVGGITGAVNEILKIALPRIDKDRIIEVLNQYMNFIDEETGKYEENSQMFFEQIANEILNNKEE